MSHEALKSYFEESEYEKASQRANIEGLAEKMEQIKNDPDYRLNQLEEKIDKTPDTFETRFNAFKKAVEQAEQLKQAEQSTTQATETVIQSAAEKLHIKKEELYQWLEQDLSQGGDWKWPIALWALKLTKDTEQEPSIFNTIKKVFGGIVLSIFGWEVYKKYKQDLFGLNNPEIDQESENEKKLSQNEKFKFVASAFITIFDHDNKGMHGTIIKNENFNALQYSDLLKIKQWGYKSSEITRISKQVWQNETDVLSAIKLLTEERGYEVIRDIFQKKPALRNTYKTLTIEDLMLALNDDINILNNIGSVDVLSKIDVQNPGNTDKSVFEELDNKGLSREIVLSMLEWEKQFEFRWSQESIFNSIMGTIEGHEKKEKNKEKVSALVNFGLKIQETMFWDSSPFQIYNDSGWESISSIFKNQPLTLSNVAKISLLTWQNTDISKLNSIQQTALYLTIIDFLEDRDKDPEVWSYFTALAEQAAQKGSNTVSKIPDGVKNVIGDTMQTTIKLSLEWAEKMIQQAYWAFMQNKTAGTWFAAVALFGPWFTKRQSLISMAMRR